MKDDDDVIIARLCGFGKTLYFSFRKGYVAQILEVGLTTGNN